MPFRTLQELGHDDKAVQLIESEYWTVFKLVLSYVADTSPKLLSSIIMSTSRTPMSF